MATSAKASRVIDSDGHVMEPPTIWQEYGDPALRDRLPKVVTTTRGEKFFGFGEFAAYSDLLVHTMGQPVGEVTTGGEDWDEASRHKMALQGGWDPAARLVDMDADGIDIAVLYPTFGLAWVQDPSLFNGICRAYNSWLHDYCAADRNRLVGVGIVALQDPLLAVAEMQRCVNELGFKAIMVRPAPYVGTYKLYHPVYDVFWQEAQDLDVAVGVHPLPFGDMANSCRGLRLDEGHSRATDDLFLMQGLTNALDMQVAMAWFVGGGICERFPRLRVAILEGSGGWVVTMLERLDHHFHIFGTEYQKTPPSELFRRQCWISFDPDEVALPFTAEHLGADRIIWASDYPHPDAKIPGVVQELRDAVKVLDRADQARILGGTAAALYKL